MKDIEKLQTKFFVKRPKKSKVTKRKEDKIGNNKDSIIYGSKMAANRDYSNLYGFSGIRDFEHSSNNVYFKKWIIIKEKSLKYNNKKVLPIDNIFLDEKELEALEGLIKLKNLKI
ncbi:hypothetical protein SLOPH_1132 [Spraguea lophii 42_110]|uniref:Uncharacterized protein n=1 Tax=Spraguea lophii (strain 42_110) TaxID=1358809 RepID=S7W9R8_SPRLO|nr:hypothetical protein SLOPH_1132 [Spraguea lophii 42_110]